MDFRDGRPERFFDIRYSDLVTDPMAALARIYDFVGQPLAPESEASMREWAVENTRDQRPVHRYTLEQFGFSEESIARDFERYRRTFLQPNT